MRILSKILLASVWISTSFGADQADGNSFTDTLIAFNEERAATSELAGIMLQEIQKVIPTAGQALDNGSDSVALFSQLLDGVLKLVDRCEQQHQVDAFLRSSAAAVHESSPLPRGLFRTPPRAAAGGLTETPMTPFSPGLNDSIGLGGEAATYHQEDRGASSHNLALEIVTHAQRIADLEDQADPANSQQLSTLKQKHRDLLLQFKVESGQLTEDDINAATEGVDESVDVGRITQADLAAILEETESDLADSLTAADLQRVLSGVSGDGHIPTVGELTDALDS